MVVSRQWHWPEYLCEAAALGVFMIAASICAVVIEHPESAVRQAIGDPTLRRLLMGLAMGGTAIAIIYSPMGARSGAHMNPSTTLAFARLGKIAPRDAAAYVVAQCAGAGAGVVIASVALSPWLAHASVNYVATVPGPAGPSAAFAAELIIAFVLMHVVLALANSRHAKLTGLAAGSLVALYILVEAPVSGMSLNPARSLAPALLAGTVDSLWIYLIAPVADMALAAEVHVRRGGRSLVPCAKLNHAGSSPCIFRCRMSPLAARRAA